MYVYRTGSTRGLNIRTTQLIKFSSLQSLIEFTRQLLIYIANNQ